MNSGAMQNWSDDEFEDNRWDPSTKACNFPLSYHGDEQINQSKYLNLAELDGHEENSRRITANLVSQRNIVRCDNQSAHGISLHDLHPYSDFPKSGGTFKSDEAATLNRTEFPASKKRGPADDVVNMSQLGFGDAFEMNNSYSLEDGLPFGENDQTFFDWPSIDNFEDVDKLFRSSDCTFGQERAESSYELPWLPSAASGSPSRCSPQPGLQAFCSGLEFLNESTSIYGAAEAQNIAEFGASSGNDRLISSSCQYIVLSPDAVENRTNAPTEKDMVGSQYDLRENTLPPGPLTSKSKKFAKMSVQKDLTESAAVAETFHRQSFKTSSLSGRQTETNVTEPGIEEEHHASTVCLDSPMALDASHVPSISSLSSPEEITFLQLQNVVTQLDLKTKLCMRDSLYRLARTAKQRHSLSTGFGGESESSRGDYGAGMSTSLEPEDDETETNPIDRSIALLLFYRLWGPNAENMDYSGSITSCHSEDGPSQQSHYGAGGFQ